MSENTPEDLVLHSYDELTTEQVEKDLLSTDKQRRAELAAETNKAAKQASTPPNEHFGVDLEVSMAEEVWIPNE